MHLGTMSIEPRAVMPKVTRLGWPNLDTTGHSWSSLPLCYNPCDPHELTAALSHEILQEKRPHN